MALTSVVALHYWSIRLVIIIKGLSLKTHCVAIPLIFDSSMFSVDGKDQQQMQHYFMIHKQVISLFLKVNIILRMLALVYVMPCLFPTEEFAIILQSGEELLFGKHDIIFLNYKLKF